MSSRGPRATEFEERDYYPAPRRSAPDFEEDFRRRVVTRSPPRREDRTPAFLRDDRPAEAGPVVLSRREVETFDRHRRSPSPVRFREERLVRRPRSVSPPRHHHHHDHEHETERSRTRVIERERIREPSVERRRSPSPRPIRYVERPRPRSPEVPERDRIRARIIDRERERSSSSSASSSPSPPPQPKTIRAPTIEREVITHYRGIDHGVAKVRPPSPAPLPAPRPRSRSRARERETDIDISLSRNRTHVDVDVRSRSRSRERHQRHSEGELVVYSDRSRRRAHSAAPLRSPVNEEAEYITSKIDSRGRHGEAWHGATRDWAIIDVPPGTERVRMDGVGGGATDTSWTKYSGVRRTKFIPERDDAPVPLPAPREPSPQPTRRHESTTWDREREIEIDISRNRAAARPQPQPSKDMWTEISKDLVVREAIERMGYDYEDAADFFYVMEYLQYDDVLRLVEMSKDIRRRRKERVRDIQWEREIQDDWERSRHRHHHDHHHDHHFHPWDNERVVEREVIYDDRRPVRGYLH